MNDRHLVLDAGNTTLKVARFEGGQLLDATRIPYADATTSLEAFANWQPQRVIVSSVSHFGLAEVSGLFDVDVVSLSSSTPLPLEIQYDTPNTLGADRIASACGAAFLMPQTDLLVVDIGTCITADFVEGGRLFHGGSISPGPALRSKAMHGHTAHLPLVELSSEAPLIGKTTEQSLRSGIHLGIVDEIRGRASRLQKEFPNLRVVITGGDSVYFEKALNCAIFAHPNLTLVGLHHILCIGLETQ